MFQKASTVRRRIKVAIWGEPKCGKTRLALAFPRPAVIDTEKGTLLFSDQAADFEVVAHTRWAGLGKILEHVAGNVGRYDTLVIDSLTPLYKDLVDEVTRAAYNRSGRDNLTQFDWGVIKRRWGAFMTALTELDVNVVLSMRSKDEYEPIKDPKTGEDKSRRTGEHTPDADKSVGYFFDFILHVTAEATKSAKGKSEGGVQAKYLVTVDGTRRAKELPLYASFDVTNKDGYKILFEDTGLSKLLAKGAAVVGTGAETRLEVQDPPPDRPLDKKLDPPPLDKPVSEKTDDEIQKDVAEAFNAKPMATQEDLKVLFSRAAQVTWPDGKAMTPEDAKSLMKSLYLVDSSKDLHQPECQQFYELLNEILAGHKELSRGRNGAVQIGPVMSKVKF